MVQPLGETVTNLPLELVSIVNKAMNTEINQRYESVAALSGHLRSFCQTEFRDDPETQATQEFPEEEREEITDVKTFRGSVERDTAQLDQSREIVTLHRRVKTIKGLLATILILSTAAVSVLILRPSWLPPLPSLADLRGVATPPHDDRPVVIPNPVQNQAGEATQKQPERKPTPQESEVVPKKSAARPASTTGSLEVSIKPAASIYINGRRWRKQTQSAVLKLKPGKYELSVVHPKRKSYVEDIQVSAGKSVRRRIVLKPRR
jgi:hypothetical protein